MEFEDFKKKIKIKDKNLYVIVDDKESFSKIKFSVSNETTLKRAQTLFTKEPITIQWIRSFKKILFFLIFEQMFEYIHFLHPLYLKLKFLPLSLNLAIIIH